MSSDQVAIVSSHLVDVALLVSVQDYSGIYRSVATVVPLFDLMVASHADLVHVFGPDWHFVLSLRSLSLIVVGLIVDHNFYLEHNYSIDSSYQI